MQSTPTTALLTRLPTLGPSSAARQVLGIVTVIGALVCARPPAAAAQAIGTLQVVARVTPADSEWGSLRAAQQLADRAPAAIDLTTPSRIALPLSLIQWIAPGARDVGDGRPAIISVQYLRN
jgi:hypothetical protein